MTEIVITFGKVGSFIMKYILPQSAIAAILIIFVFAPGNFTCKSDESVRIDRKENIALEQICNTATAEKALTQSVDVFREYVCICAEFAGNGTANNCEKIINVNNSIAILKTCRGKDKSKRNESCEDLFQRRK